MMNAENENAESGITEYVTAMIGGQLFGLPISRVQDVFMPDRLTRVPLASGDVAGVLICAGALLPRSTCVHDSACQKMKAAGRRWR